MKKYHLNIITYLSGVMFLCILTCSVARAGGQAGVVRISDFKQKPVTQKSQEVTKEIRKASFSLPSTGSWTLAPRRESAQCENCKPAKSGKLSLFHRFSKSNKCDQCRPPKPNKIGLINRLMYCVMGDKEDNKFESEYDDDGNKTGKSKRHRKEKHIRSGHYTKVYAVNPWHHDPRNGKVYAAKGYGIPMTVPLAPNVEYEYNYGWGIPSSRLTPLSKPPAQFVPPYPAHRPPVVDPNHGRHRIETPYFQGRTR